jgi:hypothetical protein
MICDPLATLPNQSPIPLDSPQTLGALVKKPKLELTGDNLSAAGLATFVTNWIY